MSSWSVTFQFGGDWGGRRSENVRRSASAVRPQDGKTASVRPRLLTADGDRWIIASLFDAEKCFCPSPKTTGGNLQPSALLGA